MNGLGYGLVFPVAALYGERAGLSFTAITALVALHPLARLVSGPVWGRLADRYGRRPVLLAGVLLQAVGHLVFGLSGAAWGLGLGRAFTGLGSGEAVAANAAVADLTTPQERAQGLGELRAATGLGMLAGPVVGGLLGLGDLAWPGLAAAAGCVVSAIIIATRFRETRRPEVHAVEASVSAVAPVALAIAGGCAASMALAECIVPLAIEHVLVPTIDLGMPPRDAALVLSVGVILAWGLTTAVFDGAVSARIVARFGDLPTARVGLALWAVAFALTPPVYRLGIVPGGLAVALTAIPVSLAGVGLATWISRTAGPSRQGAASGATQSAMALGEFVGPALAGALFTRWYGLPYLVGAGVLAVGFAAAFTLRRGPLSPLSADESAA